MAIKTWTVQVEGRNHTVEFERGTFSTKYLIRLDGAVVHHGRSYATDFGTDDSFQIGTHLCTVHTRSNWNKVEFDLSLDGVSIESGRPVTPHVPLPTWSWPFIAACLLIPFVTLGGTLPTAIGFGGAAICFGIARDPARPKNQQIAWLSGLIVLCWGGLIGLLIATPNARTIFASTQPGWQLYSSGAGAYSILMPGKPIEQPQTVNANGTPVDLHVAAFEDQSSKYIVSYSDDPTGPSSDTDVQKILDGNREVMLTNTHGTLLNDKPRSLNLYPG